MKKNSTPVKTIDEYIAAFPADVQSILQQIRTVVRTAVPDAHEAIKYRIPTFVLGENLVHFAAFKNHISFFPTSSGIRQFKKQLARFHTSKGTVQFPLGQPVPYGLLKQIAKFRANEAKGKRR